MTLSPQQTISEIVRADYRTADVFKKYGINYCCSGHATLEAACNAKGIGVPEMICELGDATRNMGLPGNIRFGEWKISFLIDYIVNLHHAFLVEAIPALESRILAFANSHGKKYPEVAKMLRTFNELAKVLLTHTREEEAVIFPYIAQIDAALRRKEPYGKLFVRTLRKPLESNGKDHLSISRLLIQLREESNHFEHPHNACVSQQVLYYKLREFHDDLVQHMHLENNVLIPRALAIEKELLDICG